MNITVCIGSACHIKGSRDIVEELQRLIRENGLGDSIELNGGFCMGTCSQGVCVTVNGKLYTVSPETVNDFFEKVVLPGVRR